jgi:3-oxosteroid 1-dehydrogenase
VGYGGAGAVAAITANDAGVKTLILEKNSCDLPGETRHTPSTRIAGGGWYSPEDVKGAIEYMKGMFRVSNETSPEQVEMLPIFAKFLSENQIFMKKMAAEAEKFSGFKVEIQNAAPVVKPASPELVVKVVKDGAPPFTPDHPELPGADSTLCFDIKADNYRPGAALFRILSDVIQERKIPVLWETPALHLISEGGEVRGVIARHQGKEIRIKASRAIILATGGFEFNEWMKRNYLRAYPAYFTGNPASTGDGITMSMELGANLWHMNNSSWRAVMKYPEFESAFSTQLHETGSIFINKFGSRFTNERFKMHTFGYELINYDCYAMAYPKIPFYWIFDEKRRQMASLTMNRSGINAPPGGVMGKRFYQWSADNTKEIEKGWIMKSGTIEGLVKQIQADPDNNGLLTDGALPATVKKYNSFCKARDDQDFHKSDKFLQPIEDAPYYAVKLWPGGPNTQGGPQRNSRAQVLRVDRNPIPRLYAAGELGSVWGMMYQGGGNIAECIAFGRIAGANASTEKVWK